MESARFRSLCNCLFCLGIFNYREMHLFTGLGEFRCFEMLCFDIPAHFVEYAKKIFYLDIRWKRKRNWKVVLQTMLQWLYRSQGILICHGFSVREKMSLSEWTRRVSLIMTQVECRCRKLSSFPHLHLARSHIHMDPWMICISLNPLSAWTRNPFMHEDKTTITFWAIQVEKLQNRIPNFAEILPTARIKH